MNDFNRRGDRDRRKDQFSKDQFFFDFNETKRQIAQGQRRTVRFMCAWVGILIGVLIFSCWCLYHVLKAKRLVP